MKRVPHGAGAEWRAFGDEGRFRYSECGQNPLVTEDVMIMRVEFYRHGEGRLCGWVATPPHRRAFEGTTMASGRDLPHDLSQFTIERALGIRDGFWGLLAHGAWFASVPGRRPTRLGRALVNSHYDALVAVEGIVNEHFSAWRRKQPTPLGPELDVMYARWLGVASGGKLVLEWPVLPLPDGRRQSRDLLSEISHGHLQNRHRRSLSAHGSRAVR